MKLFGFRISRVETLQYDTQHNAPAIEQQTFQMYISKLQINTYLQIFCSRLPNPVGHIDLNDLINWAHAPNVALHNISVLEQQ